MGKASGHAEELADIVGTLMRVMLVSERTAPEHQHAVRYNPLDFHTLGLLRVQGGMRASDLADRLGIARTTASSVIERLVKRGLILKQKSADDGRAVALSLTEEGAELAATIRAQDLRNMELFLSPLSDDERRTLLALLGRVSALVDSLDAAQ